MPINIKQWSFQSPGYRLISYVFLSLSLLQLAFLWPHFAKAFTLFCLPLRLQEDNMGKKKIWKKVSFLSWPIVPFHSVLFLHKWVSWFCCELSLLYSMFFMWSLLYHFLYFSLVSNWPWFLELFLLCLLHLFTLAFWTYILCTNLDMVSLVTLNT